MALTPDEILNKTFKTTKFSEGYDQDEVDDFLDEVTGELRRLTAENESLQARVAELEQELEHTRAAGPATASISRDEVVAESASGTEPNTSDDDSVQATGLLARAGRLHDEHVAEGVARRDELIAEAEARVTEMTTAAEERQAASLRDYEEKKANIEAKIDELKTFERDYRLKLRGYIESQLRDLDRSSSLAFGGQGTN